ncbi:MAG: hypothetical protein J2P22_09995, partial [Nocardioides sp.]|nr:hypothetical protein [Nocardioides sp.]
ALRMVHGRGDAPAVVTCSGLTGAGVGDVWERVLAHRERLGAEGLADKRAHQRLEFAWALVRDELEQRLTRSDAVRRVRAEVRDEVLSGDLPAVAAADRILAAYDGESVTGSPRSRDEPSARPAGEGDDAEPGASVN